MAYIISGFKEITNDYTRLKNPNQTVYYHYTSLSALKGIMETSGLRSCHRLQMNDNNEFDYAYSLLLEVLQKIIIESINKKVFKRSNTIEARIHIDKFVTNVKDNIQSFLKNQTDHPTAYCACLTSEKDDPNLWETYSNNGGEVALGFNLYSIFQDTKIKALARRPYIYGMEIIYDRNRQSKLIQDIISCGVNNITFRPINTSNELTEFLQAIMVYCASSLTSLLPYIKDSKFSKERELRFIFILKQ